MKLRNSTNIPDDTIRAVVRDVCPAGVTGVTVTITNTKDKAARGRGWKNKALVRVPTSEWGSRIHWHAHGAYLEHVTGSRMEVLVHILAHELRHCWQSRHPKGYRVWGSRGQYSERDADAYALGMVRKFRRGELSVKPVPAQAIPTVAKKATQRLARDPLYKGVKIDISTGGGVTVAEAEAPQGKIFSTSGTHSVVHEAPTRSEAVTAVRDDIDGGFDSCEINGCDICHPALDTVAVAV